MSTVSLNFDTKQILNIERRFADTMERHIPEAVRRSLSDGRAKARTEIVRNLRPEYDARKVQKKEIFERVDKGTRISLKGKRAEDMYILMRMPDSSFGLLRFIVGRKTPAKQKGVKIRDRKKLKVKIQPGKETTLPHAFIAKGKGKRKATGGTNYQVFRRTSTNKLHRMATPSIANYATKFLGPKVAPEVSKRMQNSFTRNLRNLSKVF